MRGIWSSVKILHFVFPAFMHQLPRSESEHITSSHQYNQDQTLIIKEIPEAPLNKRGIWKNHDWMDKKGDKSKRHDIRASMDAPRNKNKL